MDIWNFIVDHLIAGNRVILIVVIDNQGSSPGRTGFKMAVSGDGRIAGSVGGGVMEYNMVELARKMTRDLNSKPIIKRQIHDSEVETDKSGMICSGEQTHAFIPISSNNLDVIKTIKDSLDRGECGTLTLSPNTITFAANEKLESNYSTTIEMQTGWIYKENLGYKDTVYIFGAGHISVPLSQILRMLDFRVVVYDNRKDLSTFTCNSFANQKEIIDYHNVSHLVNGGEYCYVVIMSFGHKFDQIILKQMLAKKMKYLGMIGSKHKVQSIYDNLREFGFTDDNFMKVDSPIGIPIKSQTPVEIAISIAAKIIQVRNE